MFFFLWVVSLCHLMLPILSCCLSMEIFMVSSASDSAKFSNIGFNFLKEPAEMEPLFHSMALQQYIILCSQVFSAIEIS